MSNKFLPKPTSSTAVFDDLLTIFAANEFVDNESAGGFDHSPNSTREEVDDNLLHTSYIFIRNLNILARGLFQKDDAIEPLGPEAAPSGLTYCAEYAVENVHTETILIAKEVRVLPDEKGRIQISYNVEDPRGRVIFTTDGYETQCGIHVLLKGPNDVVRGKVTNQGLYRYIIKDFVTGIHYEVKTPCWLTFCACFACCIRPILQLRECRDFNPLVYNTTSKLPEETVALISKRKWKGTLYDDRVQFGIHFIKKNVDADTKLFIVSAALILFHIYFKSSAREKGCLVTFIIFCIIIVLIVGAAVLVLYS